MVTVVKFSLGDSNRLVYVNKQAGEHCMLAFSLLALVSLNNVVVIKQPK